MKIFTTILLSFCISCLAAQDFKQNEYSRELRNFATDVVFTHEIRGSNKFIPFRTKVSLYVQADDQVKLKVVEEVKLLAKLTDFEIIEAEKPSVNKNTKGITYLNIYIAASKEVEDIARDFGHRISNEKSYAYFFRKIKNVDAESKDVFYDVQHANIYVRDNDTDLYGSIKRSYLSAIGFPALSEEIPGLYFSKNKTNKELTSFDKLFVKFIYAYFKAGQTKTDLKKLVKAEWENFALEE